MIEDKNLATTPLSEIGEFGLIEHLTKAVKINHKSTIFGIGDDAAILDSNNQKIVVSTDTLTELVHFNLAYTPLKHLGYKAIASSISDVCAMNAIPKQVLVSIAVSNRFSLEALEELYKGIRTACKVYAIDLVGGDTTSSNTGLVINVTAIGYANKEEVVYRKGAKENDLLVVSGDLGAAYFGLQILERENQVYKVNPKVQPDLSSYNYLLERQLKPEARVDIIKLFKALNLTPTAMIDVSDGLASEVLHLSQHSKLGFTIYEDMLPMDQQVIATAEEFSMNSSTACLNGGEDYELLFTIALSDQEKIKGNPNFTVIGYANEPSAGNNLVGRGRQTQIPITAQGWNAFSGKKSNQNEQ